MTPKRLFLVQTLFEAIIPVIGYFEWNWDLSFILLFYFLDWVLATAITAAKGIRRYRYSSEAPEKRILLRSLLLSSGLLASACTLTALAIVQLVPELSWTERIWKFLTYKDLGIEQGIILVPLMVLNGIMVYRQQFVTPARYRTQTMGTITQPLVQQGALLLGSSGLLLGMVQFVQFPQEVLIFVSIGAISAYRWLVIRNVR